MGVSSVVSKDISSAVIKRAGATAGEKAGAGVAQTVAASFGKDGLKMAAAPVTAAASDEGGGLFWKLFNKAFGVIYDIVHKHEYGH